MRHRIAGAFVCLFLVFTGFSQNPDIDLLKSINVGRNTALDPTFEFISNSVAPLVIGVSVASITKAIVTRDSLDKSNAIFVCSGFLIAGVVGTSLKYAVDRERPFVTYSFLDPVQMPSDPSFPSNHTSFAFSLATSVSMTYPKWYVIAPSFLYAGLVGYSRMFLGVHYPSDVFVGAIIGTGSAFLSKRLTKWINSSRKKKR